MFDLTKPADRARLSAMIAADVEADTVEEYAEGFRWHLGASVIGRACERQLWSSFRWLDKEEHDGQRLRLFKRGHFEEPKFIHRLQRIGFRIFDVNEENEQFKISGHNGHYGGSLDSVGIAPERYAVSEPLLLEYKTHGDKYYTQLAGKAVTKKPYRREKPNGVQLAKPEHYSQMCSYGQAYGLRFGLYCAINKNTDELWWEIVELDWSKGENLYDKAGRIIWSQEPPRKISNSAAFFECKQCEFYGICHHQQPPKKNCRSCRLAVPTDGGEWLCQLANEVIPRDFVSQGCDKWNRIV